jgi:hypothetical protein
MKNYHKFENIQKRATHEKTYRKVFRSANRQAVISKGQSRFASTQITWDYSKTPPAEQMSSDDQGAEIKKYVEYIPGRIYREFIENGRQIYLYFMSAF